MPDLIYRRSTNSRSASMLRPRFCDTNDTNDTNDTKGGVLMTTNSPSSTLPARGAFIAIALLNASLAGCSSDESAAAVVGGAGGSGASGASAGSSGASAGSGSTQPQSGISIKLAGGPIQGKLVGSTRQFLGIPYAKPPVGELRFMPPQPAAAWTEMRDATAFGPPCPQPASVLSAAGPSGEDCLSLNVYAPDAMSQKALPVMVFIHGGAFVTGASSQYDAQALSEAGPVVIVSLNYRLGAFGFLSHPQLDAARSGTPSGSDGIRDQQLALHWVHDNIGVFGGDPKNVTVFGESAGAMSVCLHMVSPSSKDLAQHFIMESGVCVASSVAASPKKTADALGMQLSDALCSGESDLVKCLRAQSIDALVNWGSSNGLLGAGWGPAVDGAGGVLPQTPEVLMADAQFKPGAMIVGTNKNEWGLFQLIGSPKLTSLDQLKATIDKQFGEHASQVEAQYKADADGQANDVYIRLVTDVAFRCPTRAMVRLVNAKGGDIHMYSFEQGTAFHAQEIDYVFASATLSSFGGGGPPSMALTQAVQHYWTQFAATGDPNAGDNPNWPRYQTSGEDYLRLVDPPKAGQELSKADCDFWADYIRNGGTVDLNAK